MVKFVYGFLGMGMLFSSVSGAAVLQSWPSYNKLPVPLTAYPALTANDRACARAMGGIAISDPAVGPFQTPATLGAVCGVSSYHLSWDGYLTAMFVEYIDAHRNYSFRYCPASYDTNGNPDPSIVPGALCGF